MVSDDENDQSVTNQAFEVLHFIVAQRLALGRLTVVDATNVQIEAATIERVPLWNDMRGEHGWMGYFRGRRHGPAGLV